MTAVIKSVWLFNLSWELILRPSHGAVAPAFGLGGARQTR